MQIHQFSTVNAFLATDLSDAPVAAGIVRSGKKILTDGAVNLARQITYAAALGGLQVSGASAGINVPDPEQLDAAIAAFVTEVADLPVRLDAGKGVSAAALAPLAPNDDRSALSRELAPQLIAASVLGAIEAVRPIAGSTIACEATGAAATALSDAATTNGATWQPVGVGELTATADVLVVGSKTGLIDHVNLSQIQAPIIVSLAPLPITARGLADAARASITVLPDCVSTAGALWAAWGPIAELDEASALAAVRELARTQSAAAIELGPNPTVGACELAERFLGTWTELPFGRPIA